ncbi:MAG: cyclic nucleotide-binding domain-containing protein [Proteobacteria bacterium]|nr:cyclic nucleotide-binding domain-containing protein [Pseudomonadota bacterium]
MSDNGKPAAADEQQRRTNAGIVSRSYAAGETVYSEGDEGEVLFVIQQGAIELRPTNLADADPPDVERLGPGDTFGEMTVIRGSRREATAIVTQDAKLLLIDALTYSQMVRDNAEIAVRIIRRLAMRLDDTTQRAQRYRITNELRVPRAGAPEPALAVGMPSRPPWLAAAGIPLPEPDDVRTMRQLEQPSADPRRRRALILLLFSSTLLCAAIAWRTLSRPGLNQPTTVAGAVRAAADTPLPAAPPEAARDLATAPTPAAPTARDPVVPSAPPAAAGASAVATPPADARETRLRRSVAAGARRRPDREPPPLAVRSTAATLRIEAETAGTVEIDGLSRGPAPVVVNVAAGVHALVFVPDADAGIKLKRSVTAGAGVETIVRFSRTSPDAPGARTEASPPDDRAAGGASDGSASFAGPDVAPGDSSQAASPRRTVRTDNKNPWRN